MTEMRFKLEGGDRVVKVISPDLAVVIDYSDCIGIRSDCIKIKSHCNYPELGSAACYWTDVPALIEGLQMAMEQCRASEGAWREAGKPQEASPAMVALHDQQRAASEVELARAEAAPDPLEG